MKWSGNGRASMSLTLCGIVLRSVPYHTCIVIILRELHHSIEYLRLMYSSFHNMHAVVQPPQPCTRPGLIYPKRNNGRPMKDLALLIDCCSVNLLHKCSKARVSMNCYLNEQTCRAREGFISHPFFVIGVGPCSGQKQSFTSLGL